MEISEIIVSRTNQRVKRLIRMRDQASPGQPWFVVEGKKLLQEVINSPHTVAEVYVADDWEDRLPPLAGIPAFSVTKPVMEKLSLLETPCGVVALCRQAPGPEIVSVLDRGRWLVLDGVQDPGNTGAIIRSVEAFGSPPLVMLPPAPSPFHSKVMRASMGSALRVPCWRPGDSREFLEEAARRGMRLWSLDPRGEVDFQKVTVRDNDVFVIGNEGHGISESLRPALFRSVRLPMEAPVESLNAAVCASIILFQHYLARSTS